MRAEVLIFASYMPPGVYQWSYLARATTPGDSGPPPDRAEGRGQSGHFVLGPPALAAE